VRQHVARNQAATPEILERILADENPKVRSQLLRRYNLTGSLVARLAGDPDPQIRKAATRALAKALT
ncbi:MAG: hypothetical protein WCP28_14165, partial [Actinomycetes bacterium]